MKRPLAYITAPWGKNEFENTETAARYCRAVYDAGFSPVCPLLFLPLFLNDAIPQEHKPKTKGNADLDDYDYGDDDDDYEDAPLESEADTDEETDGGDEPI